MPVRLHMMRDIEVDVRLLSGRSRSDRVEGSSSLESSRVRYGVGRWSDQAMEKGCDIHKETAGR